MDWAEEKYDVSGVYICKYMQQSVQYSTVSDRNPFLCLAPETPDCSGEDGGEGPVPLHASAHVLGSL